MGKNTQSGQINENVTDKTNPSFKWARMLHLLDYHRWNYVKKVLAHKKNGDGRNNTENNSNAIDVIEIEDCGNNEIIGNPRMKENLEQVLPTNKCPLPLSPATKSSSSPPSSPTAKTSRAKKIKKLIAKEVSKRRGKHRRSSTCPVSSELSVNDQVHHKLGNNNEGNIDGLKENAEVSPRKSVTEGGKKCVLCKKMKLECHLGDKKSVHDEENQKLDQIKLLLQEIPHDAISQTPVEKNVGRSISSQHSKEFLDAVDVLSVNKNFFLRILEDPRSSLRDHFLAQQAEGSTKRKILTKLGTFPTGEPSRLKDTSPNIFKRLKRSHSNQNSSKHLMIENIRNSNDGRQVGIRFKDLRQKIKHVIKENRMERHRIAMDAVLHKVPYGHSSRDSPRVSNCESDFLVSPSNKDGNSLKRRSPSLDESLDKYCQLFETTSSFNREPKLDTTPEISRLKVTNDDASRCVQRGLGRIFSSPDLEVYTSQDFIGSSSSRTPNRRFVSFSDYKVLDITNNNAVIESGQNEEIIIQKDSKEEDLGFSSIITTCENEVNRSEYLTDNNVECGELLAEDGCKSDNGMLAPHIFSEAFPLCSNGYDFPTDLVVLEGTISEESEETQAQELPNEDSPTFACQQIDDNQEASPLNHLCHPTHHTQVSTNNQEDFDFVRDILQRSGYSGNQLLGTWYSANQPVDPSLFADLEGHSLIEPKYSLSKEGIQRNRLLLFDLINEILLSMYERSVSYWCEPLSTCSRTHPMPKGYHVLEEVWGCINWYMRCSKCDDHDPSLDYITSRDLSKDDGWMNLQFDAECVGLELDSLIFEDLLVEIVS